MLMNELFQMKLFSLLSESSQVTNEEMQNAYGGFRTLVTGLSDSEIEFSEILRTLNHTRIEFDSLGLSPLYGQEKKCPEICLSPKIDLIA